MARSAALVYLLILVATAASGSVAVGTESAKSETQQSRQSDRETKQTPLTAEQATLVDWATGRFAAQGLQLPENEFIFTEDLQACRGHKGLYFASTKTLQMCSMDPITMLHELAHGWANETLSDEMKREVVRSHGLPSWNDQDDDWEQRGTEHVAETIAWALAEDPHHVKWVETLPDGSKTTSHRILTLGADVETLLKTFEEVTGMRSVFRHADEWAVAREPSPATSPELARLGG